MQMNHIKNLENENKKQAVEIIGLRSLVSDIKSHLSFYKFNRLNDNVSANDILHFLKEGEDLTQKLIEGQELINSMQ